ncbi:hypothetical protein OAV21_03505 [bacterium]|nr:hypothetical protein [bacterium]
MFDALEDEERVFLFHCSNCEGPIQTTWNTIGSSATCPHCDLEITIVEDPQDASIAGDTRTDESEVDDPDAGGPDESEIVQSRSVDLPPAPLGPPSLVSKLNSTESTQDKACPYCAEMIKRDALICRFCKMDLSSGQLVGVSSRGPQHAAAPTGEAGGKGLIMSLFRISMLLLAVLTFFGGFYVPVAWAFTVIALILGVTVKSVS